MGLAFAPATLGTSGMTDSAYHALYLEGIRFFNECDFFEAHEVWEELWQDEEGESKKYYQGLIQAAVALHHFGNENIRGARKLNVSCRKYLDPYRPSYLGLDLDKFLAQLDQCFAEAMASTEEFPQVKVVPDLIPEIHLDPAVNA